VKCVSHDLPRYHNGPVWPHNSAMCRRARTVRVSQTSTRNDGVTVRGSTCLRRSTSRAFSAALTGKRFRVQSPYPVSCSPQVWASTLPFWLLRTWLLGLEPCIPGGVVVCPPSIPDPISSHVENLRLAGARVDIEATASTVKARRLPHGFQPIELRRVPHSNT